MTKKLAMFTLMLTIMVSAMYAVPLTEGFEGTFPPTDWTNTIVTGHEWTANAEAYAGVVAAGYAGTGTPSEGILMTPRLDLTADAADSFSFWYKQALWSPDQNELYVELSTDGGATWVELAHLMNAEAFTQETYDLETYPQTDDSYIRFRAIDAYGYYTLVDDVMGPNAYAVDNDLHAYMLAGSPTPTDGIASIYTVTVRNPGNLQQTAYDVKLMAEDGTELATATGTTIDSGAMVDFNLSWTPSVVEDINIYGMVDFAADANMANNMTAMMAVSVQSSGTTVVTIGTGTDLDYHAPYNLYYQSSLAQMIYPATDITAGGLLTAVSFHANIVSTDIPAALPINIWIGETANTTVTAFESSTNLTQVYQGTVDFVAGDADYLFTLDTPYAYGGSNLLISVERPMDTGYYSSSDVWLSTACPSGEAAYYQSDTTAADPTAPPAATAMTVKANVQLFFATADLGSISGIVTDGTNPIAGAELNIVGENFSAMTAVDGTYSFPFLPAGTYSLVASNHGYADSQVDNVVVTVDMATTQDLTMTMLPMVNVTGQILASDTAAGVMGSIELIGYEDYMVDTDANGFFTVSVFSSQMYEGTASADGYASTSFTADVMTVDLDLGTITVTEVMIPANTVIAALNGPQTEVDITWSAPGAGGTSEWIHKDSGENADGIGLTGGGSFKVAVKFEAAEVQDYNGMFLSRIKYWPNAAGTYIMKVWSGDDGLTEIYSEAVAAPVIGEWNEYQLAQSVTVDGSTALWIGYEVTHGDAAYPAGTDAGPHVAGGDMIMMSTDTTWGELHVLASTLDYNWNIQGYVGWSSTRTIADHKVPVNPREILTKNVTYQLAQSGITKAPATRDDRPLTGYNVYRLETGEEANPNAWTMVGAFITDLMYADAGWPAVAPGFYKWAVRAIYTNDVEAPASFSNEIIKNMLGYIDGTVVVAETSAPIVGATVVIDGQTVMTDDAGYYMLPVLEGIYTVTCSAPGYVTQEETNVAVGGTSVTTVNFAMSGSAIIFEDGFESYTDFVLDFAPWTQIDNDGLGTYSLTNYTFENASYTGSYIVFNPTTTTPAVDGLVAYEGDKMAACFAAVPAAPITDNDDWLITPQIHIYNAGDVMFQARSYVADYGLERFNVAVSTTGNSMEDFNVINGPNYLEAPVEWTEYSFSLDMYANQDIYIAIQCVSSDAFIFFVDNFAVDSPNASEGDVIVPVVTALNSNYPNPFNPVTTISYSVKQSGPVSIDIYNVRGQKVKTLVNEENTAGTHSVVWSGDDNNGKTVASGVYFYKMNSRNFNQTKKMMLMK